jgi:FkbM family methyltransferase
MAPNDPHESPKTRLFKHPHSEGSGYRFWRRARFLKEAIQFVLGACGYRLVCSPRNQVAGLSLIDDVRLVVGVEDPVCFDVGANEGQTIELLQKAFKRPKIYAFEPSTQAFARLSSRNHGSGVALENVALGRENGRREFTNYEDTCLSSFLALDAKAEGHFLGTRVETREIVDIRTVDWFVEQHQVSTIDLLKIDTQGYDLEVLEGALATMRQGRIRNVLVELNLVTLYKGQSDPVEIERFLREHGFHLVELYDKFRRGPTVEWCNALYTNQLQGS